MRQVLRIDMACSRLMIGPTTEIIVRWRIGVGVRCENRCQHLQPPTMDGLTGTCAIGRDVLPARLQTVSRCRWSTRGR